MTPSISISDRNFVPFSEAGPQAEVWFNGAMREFTK
jgi:hypothetical protein